MGVVFDSGIRGGEVRLSGVSCFNDANVALGRLYLWSSESVECAPSGALICLVNASDARCATSRLALSKPCAAVLSSSAVSARLLDFLIRSRIPYLILKNAQELSSRYQGKVALLDTQNDMLIIDPSLETLNRYPLYGRTRSRLLDEPYPFCERKYITKERNGRGIMLSVPATCEGGELFDILMGLAESPYAIPVSVTLSIPSCEGERESFCDNVEAVFKAALYGNFSVILKDYIGESDISGALACMHGVFCRLEEDGREFNGYLRRGILVDSPLWLMRRCPLKRPDLMYLDFDSLLCRLFGCEPRALLDSSDAQIALYELWEQYLDVAPHGCRLAIISSELCGSSLFENFVSFTGADEIYDGKIKP